MKTAAALLALSLASCAHPEDVEVTVLDHSLEAAEAPAGAAEAVAAILGVYGPAPGAAPAVHWYDGTRLDCPGQPWNWLSVNGDCIDGAFLPKSNAVIVSDLGRAAPISRMALAHELCHWHALRTTGDGDAAHAGPCVVEGSGGRIDQANEAVEALGY